MRYGWAMSNKTHHNLLLSSNTHAILCAGLCSCDAMYKQGVSGNLWHIAQLSHLPGCRMLVQAHETAGQ
jgi:hypothetical protein